jgi:hypothetical protein
MIVQVELAIKVFVSNIRVVLQATKTKEDDPEGSPE